MTIRETVPAVVAADGWFNQTEAVSIAPAEERQSLVTGVAATHGSQRLDRLRRLPAKPSRDHFPNQLTNLLIGDSHTS
jgi:hypothetical protein